MEDFVSADLSTEESQKPSHSSQLSSLSQLSQGSVISQTHLLNSSSSEGRSTIIPESAIYISGFLVAAIIFGVISISAYTFNTSSLPYVNSTKDDEELIVVGDGSVGESSDTSGDRQDLRIGVQDDTNRSKRTATQRSTRRRPTPPKVASRRTRGKITTTTPTESITETVQEDSTSIKAETTSTTEVDDEDGDDENEAGQTDKTTKGSTAGASNAMQTNTSIFSETTSSVKENKVVRSYGIASQPLLCTVSSLAVEELRYPLEYCTHLVYTHAEYDLDRHIFTAPMASLSFNTFLKSNPKEEETNGGTRPLYMVSLPGAFLEQYRTRIEKKMDETSEAMAAWLDREGLAGLALVEQTLTPDNVNMYINLTRALRKAMPARMQIILGFSSAFLKVLKNEIITLASDLDFMILETHVKEFPEQCLAMFPTAFNASRNPKVLQLKKNLFPRSALDLKAELLPDSPRTCISILMAVLMYVVPQGLLHAPSQDCVDFSWATYSEVCHQKKEFKYYEWAVAAIQSIQSRMYMFDDDTTVVNKVKRVLQLSPKTCIALYRTDLDDYSGTCNKGKPFVRVAAVRRAIGL